MSVPLLLPYGYVLLYNLEQTSSLHGIRPSNPLDNKMFFANVYQISSGLPTVLNSQVLYNPKDAVCKLVWDRREYLEIEEARLAGIDQIIP